MSVTLALGDTTTGDIDSSPSGDTTSVSTTTTNTIVSATGELGIN